MYKLINNGDSVKNLETGACIPMVGGNRDYQEYLTWLEEGNTPEPEFTEQEILDNAWTALRSERNVLLTSTDFMMTVDFFNNILAPQEQLDLEEYRNALRNLPANTEDPTDVTWPVKPQIVLDYVA